MYSFYLGANRPADAENILRAKVNNNPKNADYVLQLARYYNRAQNTAAMTAVPCSGSWRPEDFPQARLWVGDFYLGCVTTLVPSIITSKARTPAGIQNQDHLPSQECPGSAETGEEG